MRRLWGVFLVAGLYFGGCSSPPEPQPEPSKNEIRQDAEGFFKKMKQEEESGKPASP